MNFRLFLPLLVFVLYYLGTGVYATLDLTKPTDAVIFRGIPSSNITLFHAKKWRTHDVQTLLKSLYLTGRYRELTAYTVSSQNRHTLIIEGSATPQIDKITFIGLEAYPQSHMLSRLTSRLGTPIHYPTIEKDKQIVEALYLKDGFDFARVNAITVSKNVLTYTISEGKITSFNLIGLTTVAPFVIQRELRLSPGESFNSKILREDRERMLRLGYFSDISYPKLDDSSALDNAVSVSLFFKEKKVNLIDVGLEQENNQVVLFLQSNWNHVLQNSDLLSGKIQYGSENDQIYKITSYSLRYRQPWFLNKYPFSLELDFWEEFRQEFAGSNPLTQVLVKNKRRGYQIGTTIPIERDRFSLTIQGKSEAITPLESLGTTGVYNINSLATQLHYRDYTSLNNPKSGLSWALEFEKGGTLGIVDIQGLEFSRYGINVAQFMAFSDRDTFGIHGFLGVFDSSLLAFNTFESEAYTLGGANSLRGYKETDGLIGTRKALLNIELRHDFTSDFQGVLFYDLGRVYNRGLLWQSEDVHSGKGLGIRYFTPIAPIRFDLAWGDTQLILHFGLGQVF